jgi:hypothetical protein
MTKGHAVWCATIFRVGVTLFFLCAHEHDGGGRHENDKRSKLAVTRHAQAGEVAVRRWSS